MMFASHFFGNLNYYPLVGSLNKHVFFLMFLIGEGSRFIHEKPCMALPLPNMALQKHAWLGAFEYEEFQWHPDETFSHTPLIYVSKCCLECMFIVDVFLVVSNWNPQVWPGCLGVFGDHCTSLLHWPEKLITLNGGHLLNFTPEKGHTYTPQILCHSEESGGPWTKIFDIWLLTSGHAMELPLLQQAPLSHLAWGQDAPSCFQLPKMLPKHILGRRISVTRNLPFKNQNLEQTAL